MRKRTVLNKAAFCDRFPQYKVLVKKWPEGKYGFNDDFCAIEVKFILTYKYLLSDIEGAITFLKDKAKRQLGDACLLNMIDSIEAELEKWRDSVNVAK